MVLLVDDQAIIGEAVRRILQAQPGFDFHYCAEGALAVSAALRLAPLVILQDLVMPDANGLELVKAYRRCPELQQTPVIVLSTKDEPTVKKAAFEAGANDYIVKLPDPIELFARVRYHANACLAHRQLLRRCGRCAKAKPNSWTATPHWNASTKRKTGFSAWRPTTCATRSG